MPALASAEMGHFVSKSREVIQDATDPHNRKWGVLDCRAVDTGMLGKVIWTRLPDDFGKRGYGVRRAEAIKKHLSAVICEPRELQGLFDLWLTPSEDLRLYLGAHRNEQIQVARQLINILPAVAIIEILRYLVEDYWGRYAGWPDLLVYRTTVPLDRFADAGPNLRHHAPLDISAGSAPPPHPPGRPR